MLLLSHEAADTVAREVTTAEAVERLNFSLLHEQRELTAHYLQFRFAFPGRSSPLLEDMEETQRAAITRVLEGKQLLAVHYPQPISLSSLFLETSPHVAADTGVRGTCPVLAAAC